MFATKAALISEAMQTDPLPYLISHPQLLLSLLLNQMLSGCKFDLIIQKSFVLSSDKMCTMHIKPVHVLLPRPKIQGVLILS